MLVSHANLSDHIREVSQILERIRKSGLTIRPTKTYVAVKEVTFLVYTIKRGRNMPDFSLVGKIMNIHFSKIRKHVRSLLVLINCYHTFLTKWMEIVACLTKLITGTSATKNIMWSS